MRRTLDPRPFVAIAQHPDVGPWIGGSLTPELIADPHNICLTTDKQDGGYILHHLQPGLYEAHTLALPSARGNAMYSLMREGFAFLFLETDAVEVCTRCPDGNPRADRWAQLAGFRETFRREHAMTLAGESVGVSYRSLRYEDWVLTHKPNRHEGQRFHVRMDDARMLADIETHPEDPVHDAFVGAAIGCARAGNLMKGIGLYNRWAVFAGYKIATILSVNPPVVDIADAVVSLNNGDVHVLQVRPARRAPA